MPNNNLDLAFVINSRYKGQFVVTFYSVATSNPDLKFSVHLFTNSLTDEEKEYISGVVTQLGSDITFYDVDESVFEGLPKMSYDNAYTAYDKLLIPYYIKTGGKVLYLDCDIIVKGDIGELFKRQYSTFISAVADLKINAKRRDHAKKIAGGEYTYFNSGVIMFDFFHSDKIVPLGDMIDYIRQNGGDIRWHDQDILNHFYASDCTILEEKFNYHTTYKSISDAFFHKGEREAAIVHYANWKPWKSDYIGKSYRLFKRHYKVCAERWGVNFAKRRNIFAQLKLIFGYIF